LVCLYIFPWIYIYGVELEVTQKLTPTDRCHSKKTGLVTETIYWQKKFHFDYTVKYRFSFPFFLSIDFHPHFPYMVKTRGLAKNARFQNPINVATIV
jgi:hypothetical protein